jgi:hypothetical protein
MGGAVRAGPARMRNRRTLGRDGPAATSRKHSRPSCVMAVLVMAVLVTAGLVMAGLVLMAASTPAAMADNHDRAVRTAQAGPDDRTGGTPGLAR